MQQNIVSAHIYKAWLSWKIPRTFHRCRTQTLYGTVNVQGGPLSVISSVLYTGGPGCGWHSCGRGVKVRPVLCFAFMNDAACDSLLSVSACGCLLHGWTFFFFISMSSVFLSTEVCFLYGASPCWLWHKHVMYQWPNIHTSHLASGKIGCYPIITHITPVLIVFIKHEHETSAFSLIPNCILCLYPVRYQCSGSKAAEEPLQSDVHLHREDPGARPQTVEEQKWDGPLRFWYRDQTRCTSW